MNDFFNRKVRIDYNSSSLVSGKWSLVEYDSDGNVFNKDLRPWVWTLSFDCESLNVIRTISTTLADDESAVSPKQTARINGKLVSTGGEWGRPIDYSFLGTDRSIENFSLEIEEVSDGEVEGCTLFPLPKYEGELPNFIKEITEDELFFLIKLKTEQVAEIAKLIEQNALESFVLQISWADGLFSHWSPTIYTDFIKILADGCEVNGLMPGEVSPTIAGKVGKFGIVYKSKGISLIRASDGENEPEDRELANQTASEDKEWLASLISNAVAITSSAQKSVQTPLWLIFALLIVLLFR